MYTDSENVTRTLLAGGYHIYEICGEKSPQQKLRRDCRGKKSPTKIMSATLTLQGELLTKCVQIIIIIITFIRNLAAATSCHDYYPLASSVPSQ
jgi:hypothetical protein